MIQIECPANIRLFHSEFTYIDIQDLFARHTHICGKEERMMLEVCKEVCFDNIIWRRCMLYGWQFEYFIKWQELWSLYTSSVHFSFIEKYTLQSPVNKILSKFKANQYLYRIFHVSSGTLSGYLTYFPVYTYICGTNFVLHILLSSIPRKHKYLPYYIFAKNIPPLLPPT